jgi:hypothetical protein
MPDPGHCSDQEAETNRQLTTMNRILTPFTLVVCGNCHADIHGKNPVPALTE